MIDLENDKLETLSAADDTDILSITKCYRIRYMTGGYDLVDNQGYSIASNNRIIVRKQPQGLIHKFLKLFRYKEKS